MQQLEASRRFKGYKKQEPKAVRAAEIRKDPIQEGIRAAIRRSTPAFRQMTDDGVFCYDVNEEQVVARAVGIFYDEIKALPVTAADIERFSVSLDLDEIASLYGQGTGHLLGTSDEKEFVLRDVIGLAISALIKTVDEKVTLQLKHFPVKISYLCTENTGEVEVYGNVGAFFAMGMSSGNVVLHGNADECAGAETKGGLVTINGNTGRQLGFYMKGGEILVNGNADFETATGMKSGKIHINGNCRGISNAGRSDDSYGGIKNGNITVTGYLGGIEDIENILVIVEGNVSEITRIKNSAIIVKGKIGRILDVEHSEINIIEE